MLRFAVGGSTLKSTREAAHEACRQALEKLGAAPHLALVFASFDHREEFAALAEVTRQLLGDANVLGCTGESIVWNDREIEGDSALVVWVAHFPGVELVPMHLDFQATPDGGTFVGWPEDLPLNWPQDARLLLLGEPFSFPADVLLSRLAQDQPQVPAVGGMASGGWHPGQNLLLFNGRVVERGAVAVLLHGAVTVRTVVSQGCRPIGQPFVVTKAQENVVRELGGRRALEQLQAVFESLSTAEQQLVRRGLHIGQVINEYQDEFHPGDFLIRNVQGIDPDSGAVVIGDRVHVGQTVQFHVRDAETADEDLEKLLDQARQSAASEVLAALVFTCNGRGTRLFPAPSHDAQAVAKLGQQLPVAGFFAQGEIGPVGGQNFVHGFTASIALFESP